MTVLQSDALEFARTHLQTFPDTDFFPRTESFEALWGRWDDTKKLLSASNVRKLRVCSPRSLAAPKKGNGYRIVHQLDPLDALTYTALGFEAARVLLQGNISSEGVAFSYRLNLSDRSFFGTDNGYPRFIERCRELCSQFEWVLIADLSDFYNRIYVHRIENALSASAKELASDVEHFLMALNGKASQGIPVGPAASIVLSEAVLYDIDQYLTTKGCVFARYVDDIRLFAHSRESLLKFQEELCHYLYDAHRLQLNWQKTTIVSASDFRERSLNSPHLVEKESLLDSVKALCAYGDAYSDEDLDVLKARFLDAENELDNHRDEGRAERRQRITDWEQLEEWQTRTENREVRSSILLTMFERGSSCDTYDLGLLRVALRRSRQFKNLSILEALLTSFDNLGPVLPDVFQYLDAVADETIANRYMPEFRGLLDSLLFRTCKFARFWIFWFLSSRSVFVCDATIGPRLWQDADLEHQARAAKAAQNSAWVRSMKSTFGTRGPWERRAILMASALLPSSERNPWLRSLDGMLSEQEAIVSAWVKEH